MEILSNNNSPAYMNGKMLLLVCIVIMTNIIWSIYLHDAANLVLFSIITFMNLLVLYISSNI